MASLIFIAILVPLIIGTLIKTIIIVPQGNKRLVERLGKYNHTLLPGLNIVIPFIDRVAENLTTKDIVLNVPSQDVITLDNVGIKTDAIAYINIHSPEKAYYGVEDFRLAIQKLIQTSLRSLIGELKLDEALSSRELIKTKLKQAIFDDIENWGITLKSVEIQDIQPTEAMINAMEEQASAERERRAMIARSEGDKRSAILTAEGKLEAAKLEAKAQVALAEANQKAIEKISDAIKDTELPAIYLLGEKYIKSMQELSASSNSKIIVYPAEIAETIKSMLNINKINK